MPDGVLMNGKGPYQYNSTLVPDGIDYETINVQPGQEILKYLFMYTIQEILMFLLNGVMFYICP